MEKGGIRETSLTTFEPIDEYDPEDDCWSASSSFQRDSSESIMDAATSAAAAATAAAKRRSIATQRSFSQIRTSGFFGLVRTNSATNNAKTNENGKFLFLLCIKFVLILFQLFKQCFAEIMNKIEF